MTELQLKLVVTEILWQLVRGSFTQTMFTALILYKWLVITQILPASFTFGQL